MDYVSLSQAKCIFSEQRVMATILMTTDCIHTAHHTFT